ncbi:MAG: YfhO family protein [Bacteroidales bacterium]|nr:YfhO family protein [Bacteroidales bacterium]
MKPSLFKSALPHVIAVILFTVISFAYFYPVLEGRKINAHDTKVYEGSSKEISDYRDKYGREPLWTNSMFGGMPAYTISVLYPGNLFKHLDDFLKLYKTPVAALFLSMLGFYIMLLFFRVNPWLAMAGAIAYGFSSYLFVSLSAGHNTKAYAMAWIAPVIGSVVYSFRKNLLAGASLFALFLSMQIMANHVQITYYTGLIVLVFGIFELIYSIKSKMIPSFLKTLGVLVVAALIAFSVNFASLYSTWEYSKESTRGKSELSKAEGTNEKGLDKEYITQWSYGIGESLTFLIPNFKGGASAPFDTNSETVKVLRKNNMGQAQGQLYRYWGKQPSTSGPVYFGAVVLFLFVLGLLVIKGREKWWILTAALLSLLLSWGKNFMPLTSLFIDFFPGYDKFRAVSMTLVMAGVLVPLLGVLALKELSEGTIDRNKAAKSVLTAALITGGLAFIFFLVPGLAGSFLRPDEQSFPDSLAWIKEAMAADRKAMLRTDALRSFVFISGGAALIWFYLKGRIKSAYTLLGLTLLFLIDQIPVDARYLGSSNFQTKRAAASSFAPSTADKEILSDEGEFRVLNLTVSVFNDASTSYYHQSIGGYSGAKMKRYQELIETGLTDDINSLISSLRTSTTMEEAEGVMENLGILNMLNTRYIILDPGASPLYNRNALGNAWLVNEISIVENADAELQAISSINPKDVAVADRRFAEMIPVAATTATPGDTIYLSSYEPNLLTYRAELTSERVAIFSEIYYKYGWKAFIDDTPADHFRANYVLRGMTLPAGSHTITFRFEPESYRIGNKVSLAGSILLLAFLVMAAISIFKQRRTDA